MNRGEQRIIMCAVIGSHACGKKEIINKYLRRNIPKYDESKYRVVSKDIIMNDTLKNIMIDKVSYEPFNVSASGRLGEQIHDGYTIQLAPKDYDAFLVVFDVSNKATFRVALDCIDKLLHEGVEPHRLTLVGNKSDLNHVISEETANQEAQKRQVKGYCAISAKNNSSQVDRVFQETVRKFFVGKLGATTDFFQPPPLDFKNVGKAPENSDGKLLADVKQAVTQIFGSLNSSGKPIGGSYESGSWTTLHEERDTLRKKVITEASKLSDAKQLPDFIKMLKKQGEQAQNHHQKTSGGFMSKTFSMQSGFKRAVDDICKLYDESVNKDSTEEESFCTQM